MNQNRSSIEIDTPACLSRKTVLSENSRLVRSVSWLASGEIRAFLLGSGVLSSLISRPPRPRCAHDRSRRPFLPLLDLNFRLPEATSAGESRASTSNQCSSEKREAPKSETSR